MAKNFNVSVNVNIEGMQYANSPFMAAIKFYQETLLKSITNETLIPLNTMISVSIGDRYDGIDPVSFSVQEILDMIKDMG